MDNRERSHGQSPDRTATGLGAADGSATTRHPESAAPTPAQVAKALAGFPSDVELFPIRTVSSLTGVNSITLRAWERRYGLVQPVRTPTGHRLYRRDEIDLIHRVVGLLDKGIAISQVQRVLSQQPQADSPEDQGEEHVWTGYRRRLISAILRFDEDALEEIHHEALGVCSIDQLTHRLLVPVRDELSRRRETADGNAAGERFFAMYLRNKLGARFAHRSRGISGPRLLGACLPGECCEIDALLFALTAHELGLRSVLLGLDGSAPLAALKGVCNRGQCQAVVLCGTAEPPDEVFSVQLAGLVADVSVPVFVRGQISIHRRDQIVAAGAVPLGNDLMAGAKRVSDMLSERKH
jgi:DNA-binding transcriptional MerR regulator